MWALCAGVPIECRSPQKGVLFACRLGKGAISAVYHAILYGLFVLFLFYGVKAARKVRFDIINRYLPEVIGEADLIRLFSSGAAMLASASHPSPIRAARAIAALEVPPTSSGMLRLDAGLG